MDLKVKVQIRPLDDKPATGGTSCSHNQSKNATTHLGLSMNSDNDTSNSIASEKHSRKVSAKASARGSTASMVLGFSVAMFDAIV